MSMPNHQASKSNDSMLPPSHTGLVPEQKLYDRETQLQALHAAYERRTQDVPPCAELVLLNGISGSGKTSLAQAFGRQVGKNQNAIFITGKFPFQQQQQQQQQALRKSSSLPTPHSLRQASPPAPHSLRQSSSTVSSSSSSFHSSIVGNSSKSPGWTTAANESPYGPLVEAFAQFTNQVLASDDVAFKDAMIDTIKVVVGSELKLLLEILPSLGPLLAPGTTNSGITGDGMGSSERSSESQSLPCRTVGVDKQQRVVVVLRRFIRAVCCCGSGKGMQSSVTSQRRPLIVFLDDLQWATELPLKLLKELVTPSTSFGHHSGLMVIGSCRGREISEKHPLSILLRESESNGTKITEIIVPNLDLESVSSMVQERLGGVEPRASLSQQAFQHTGGNPFYLEQYLQHIHSSDSNINIHINNSESVANDYKHSLLESMLQLPQPVRRVLKICACLGGDLSLELIHAAHTEGNNRPRNLKNVEEALQVCVENGFLEYDFGKGTGHFAHDQFLEATILLIPFRDQLAFRLELGRRLMQNFQGTAQFTLHVPTITNLMLFGKSEIHAQSDRDHLALLCLRTGRQMAKSSAFLEARKYIQEGIDLLSLSPSHWSDQYDLSVQLYNSAAELAYCSGDHKAVDMFVRVIETHAHEFDDRLQACITKILSLSSRGANEEAGSVGIAALRQLGESVPSRVRRATVAFEVYRTRRLLRSKTADEILQLPKLNDSRALSVMSLLHILYPVAVISHMEYIALISCRLMCLTLQHGLCSYSCVAFAYFASVLSRLGLIAEASRIGELSLTMLEKHPTKELKARAIQRIGLNIKGYNEPLRVSVELLTESFQLGMITGDVESAMFGATSSCGMRFYMGEQLGSLVKASRESIDLCTEYGQHFTGLLCRPVLQLCYNLMGRSTGNPLILTGDAMNEEELMHQGYAEHNLAMLEMVLFCKFLLATYLNELTYARKISDHLSKVMVRKYAFIPMMQSYHCFYEGLVALALARAYKTQIVARRKELRVARERLRNLEVLAEFCPENFMNKVLLLKADLALCRGKHKKAESLYRQSIIFAKNESILPEQGLACEKLARMLRDCCNRPAEAESYFEQARDVYRKHGSIILADRVTMELEHCREINDFSAGIVMRKASCLPGCLIPELSERDMMCGHHNFV